MSRHERYEQRDRGYSNWHRYACADASTMIDLDGLDYCRRCRMPLLFTEAARDEPRERDKPTIVVETLARTCNVPAVCVLWTPSPTWREEPPHCVCQETKRLVPGCDHGIAQMRVRRIHPDPTKYATFEPRAYAQWIDSVHAAHEACAHTVGSVA